MTNKDEWRLGQTSLRFESTGAGPGTVSGGKGDLGGMSYGTYQIASRTGTVNEFLAKSGYAEKFADIQVNSSEFVAEWKRLATTDPGFAVAQHDFIQKSHYEPQVRSLDRVGFVTSSRGPAVQDMVWSTAVQYRGHATRIVTRGLTESYGSDYKIDELSDEQIVTAVQESKLRHVMEDFRSSPTNTPGIEKRIETEKYALAYLATNGVPMAAAELDSLERSFAPLSMGTRGSRVEAVQENLRDLGYLSSAGNMLDPDGHFGPSTRDALVQFQVASGLHPHGQMSVLTENKLKEQRLSRDVGMQALNEQSVTMPMCKLNDPAHPDHGMFKAARILVHDLDRRHGREPDARSDNLAASLVVAARTHGLERIDQVALSSDASRLWGVERPPGVRDHFFDRQASTDTMQGLNTPIADSSNRWPEAMQAYESVRMSEQQTQQQIRTQVQEQQQSQVQGGPAMTMTR